MELRIGHLGELGDLREAFRTYQRVDGAAFGLPPNPAQADSKLPLVEGDRWFLASLDGEPCGGAGSFPMELTLPGGTQVRVAGVGDVGVVPTHRRRGVLRALMADQLRDGAERGEAAAVLHASEGGIYRRFGYGPATRWRQVRIDARRVRWRPDRPGAAGSARVVERAAGRAACAEVHDRVRRAVPGGLSRSDAWWDVVLGDVGSYIGGDTSQLLVVHEDPDGRADGYALYSLRGDWSRGQAEGVLSVWELVGLDTGVELELWSLLCAHDLVATVVGPAPVDHLLGEAAVDPRQVGLDWEQDLLWLRPLDVAALLGTRRYHGSGELVLDVRDDLLGLGGRFHLAVEDGSGRCEPLDQAAAGAHPADLTMDVSDLGTLVLGDGSARRLVRANRVEEGRAGAAERWDALAVVDPAPWCWVRF
jgi:predicted acetyltransferase